MAGVGVRGEGRVRQRGRRGGLKTQTRTPFPPTTAAHLRDGLVDGAHLVPDLLDLLQGSVNCVVGERGSRGGVGGWGGGVRG